MNYYLHNKVKNDILKKYIVFALVLLLSAHQFVLATSNDTENTLIAMQLSKKITIDVKNKSVREVIYLIQKQTELNIVIQDEDIDKLPLVTLSMKDKTTEEILTALFKDSSYEFKIKGNNVAIGKKIVQKRTQNKITNNQKINLKGVVIDEEKNPISGATLIIKETNNGAITDEKGRFSISGDRGLEIEISCTGLQNTIHILNGDDDVIITLKKDVLAMDDVVITGYGNVKRSSYTGNAVTINRDQLLKASKSNVIKALQSFDPSFRIKENNQFGSDPNTLPEVNIRGESGMGVSQLDKKDISKSALKTNPNLPTFIMDGFEISVTKLYDFDPNRIETITILKDAAATAIYGSRAANGVVVITTVTPKNGRLNVSYNFVGDITYPDLSDYNLMNASEKLELERLAGCYAPTGSDLNDYTNEREYNQKLINVQKGIDTYWMSQPLKSVFNHKHSAYIDGGSDNFRFGIDLNYTNQDGVMRGSLRNRMGAGLFLSYNYKTLSIQNQVSYSQAKSVQSPFGNFADYTQALPYDRFKNDDGEYFQSLRNWSNESNSVDKTNPLYESTLKNYDRSLTEDIINNLSLNWNITEHLLVKGQLGITKVMSKSERFLDPLSKQNTNPLSLTNLSSGELVLGNNGSVSIDANAFISYNRSFDKHNVNVLAGMNVIENNENTFSSYYTGFPSGKLDSPNYAQKVYEKPTSDEEKTRTMGYLMTLNYSYNDIYLLDASCRIDGSSAFGSDSRFAPFWSFGLGINVHNYDFIKNSKVINQLRIRGSYGQLGNVNFPAYAARTSYITLTDEWYKTGYGVILQALGNRNLTWETTNTFDVGAEISLFKSFVYLKGSYYNKKTVDLISDVTIPSSSGFTTYRDNIGEISNRGFEFDLRLAVLRRSNTNMTVNANFAQNKNRILKISETQKAYNDRVIKMFAESERFDLNVAQPYLQYVEGGSPSSIWGMKSKGINPANGKEVFIRPDGTYTDEWVASNQMILGTKEPKGQGSLGFNFNYKRLSIYASFMYEFGGQTYNQTLVSKVENANIYNYNVDKRVLTDRWTQPGDNAKYKSILTGKATPPVTRPTSRFVQDYNVLSLNSLTISYDMSDKFLEKTRLGMMRFEIGTNDLLRLCSVKQERGLSYPYARIINFSVKISL